MFLFSSLHTSACRWWRHVCTADYWLKAHMLHQYQNHIIKFPVFVLTPCSNRCCKVTAEWRQCNRTNTNFTLNIKQSHGNPFFVANSVNMCSLDSLFSKLITVLSLVVNKLQTHIRRTHFVLANTSLVSLWDFLHKELPALWTLLWTLARTHTCARTQGIQARAWKWNTAASQSFCLVRCKWGH